MFTQPVWHTLYTAFLELRILYIVSREQSTYGTLCVQGDFWADKPFATHFLNVTDRLCGQVLKAQIDTDEANSCRELGALGRGRRIVTDSLS